MNKFSKLDNSIKYNFSKEEKREKIKLKELKPFMRFYKKYWAWFIFISLIGIIDMVVAILQPIYSGYLLASFTDSFSANTTIKYAIIAMCLLIIIYILDFIFNRLWSYIQYSVEIDLKYEIITKINSLASSNFSNNETSKFTTRLFSDVEILANIPSRIFSYITMVLTKIGFITYTLSLNVWVGLFMIGYIALYILVKAFEVNIRQKQMQVEKNLYEIETNLEMENIRGMQDIRCLNTTDSVINKINNATIKNTSIAHKFKLTINLMKLFSNLLIQILNFSFIILCVYLILNNQLELAGFMIAYNYRGSIYGFAYIIIEIKDFLNTSTLSAKRVNELYNEKLFPTETFGNIVLENVNGKIEFKNVSFSYDKNIPVLKNVSFTIQPHTIVSFVGRSGTGKSTIVGLFNKLYDLKENNGEILFDGININTLSKDCLRNNICVVSQNPYIFNMTLAENLRLAKENATDDELESVLKQAEMLDFVNSLPDKLNSQLGENGIKLSGGQKQRIAIARALLKNAKVIVFDEATSSLDNENQAKIKNVMKSLSNNHTIIMVAHRLSTVVDSDNIIFIKNGQVYAQGKHDYLMSTCEEYKKLYAQKN